MKRRKLSSDGKKKSVWSDVSHLIAKAESDLALDEYVETTASLQAEPEPKPAKPEATRQPRILQSRASDPVTPEPDAEPEERPVRRRGRPRKTVVVETAIQPEPHAEPEPITARVEDAVSVAVKEPSDDEQAQPETGTQVEKRVTGRRRVRIMGLRAGERWKRHLPRWSR
ncbi:hypothetical protein VQ042_19015 [Aurantimonas sp. A2-1-M11]|uniref:hypothetical protein n=1 Tax=Aurantimonas sp. A2-1-M11 TaxID=3113712 RepID=UPI002F9405B5